MRYLTFFIVLFMIVPNMAAQEETLFNEEIETDGFGGPVIKYTAIRNQGAFMFGGRGGWIINHSLVIGGGAYGVFTEVNAPTGVLPLEGPLDIEFEYGGLELEYIIDPQSLGHYGVYILIGGGTIRYVKDVGPVAESNQQAGESDFVFVLEPALNAELNVTKWFRLNAAISYRMVNGVTQTGLKNRDFSGVTATVTLKFGTF